MGAVAKPSYGPVPSIQWFSTHEVSPHMGPYSTYKLLASPATKNISIPTNRMIATSKGPPVVQLPAQKNYYSRGVFQNGPLDIAFEVV